MVGISLVRLMSNSLVRAIDEEFQSREAQLRRYLRETQGIDVDFKIWTNGDQGIIQAIQLMIVDDTVQQLTNANDILHGIMRRLEVMQNASVQGRDLAHSERSG